MEGVNGVQILRKAQRAQRLSVFIKSSAFRSYHYFTSYTNLDQNTVSEFWPNLLKILTKIQPLNLNWTSSIKIFAKIQLKILKQNSFQNLNQTSASEQPSLISHPHQPSLNNMTQWVS